MKQNGLVTGLVLGGLLTLSATANFASAADLMADIVKKGAITIGVGSFVPTAMRDLKGFVKLTGFTPKPSKMSKTALRNFNGLASWRKAENSLQSVNLMVWTPLSRRHVRQNGVWF